MASMTHERFQALAEAYGGEVSRWPAEAREAAALLMAADPAFTRAVLTKASALDAALDAWRPAAAPASLADKIAATAPAARSRARWLGWLSPAALGAGLAAACAAGVLVGVDLARHSGSVQELAVSSTLNALSTSGTTVDLEEGA